MDKQALKDLRWILSELESVKSELDKLPKGVKSARLTAEAEDLRLKIDTAEAWIQSQPHEISCILRLKYIDCMTYREIGERVGYSRQAIKFKLHNFWIGCN